MRRTNSKRVHVLSFLMMLAVMLFCFAGTAYAAVEYPQDIRPVPTDDLTGKVVILHTNDVHGAIDGYAKMVALRESYEALGAEVITVDAGDFSQGDAYVTVSPGEDAITMMNAAGYTVSTLGNHEFDYGYEQLKKNLEKVEFTVICANIYENGVPILDPTYLYEAKNGVKIGFIGFDTEESKTKANPNKTIGLTFYGGSDMYRIAMEEEQALREQGAALVIALTHLGVDDESEAGGNRSIDLLKNTTGIDFVIDGHSHTVMTSGEESEPIQSTGTKFEYIGVLTVGEDGTLEDHYLVSTEGIAADEASAAETEAKAIETRIDEVYSEKIAESEVVFEGAREINRSQETNSGNLVTDALRWYILKDPSALKVPEDHLVAIMNGGGIRDEIAVGDVTRKDIKTVYPFGNTLTVSYLTGEDLLEVLEATSFSTPEPTGGFPQTGGISMTIDTTKEYDQGDLYPGSTFYAPASIQRVTIHSINGQPFDPEDTYAIATTDFVSAGGDSYFVVAASDGFDTGVLLDETLINYIQEELNGVLTEEKYGKIRGEQEIILAGDTAEGSEAETAENGSEGADDAEAAAAAEGASDADAATAEEGAAVTEGDGENAALDSYTVERGDCLWRIAQKLYGDGAKWKLIYENNKDIIKQPSLIYPGQVLQLPDAA